MSKQLYSFLIICILFSATVLRANKLDTLGIPIISEFTQKICPGDSYEGYSFIGTYIDTFDSVTACDSIRTVHLSLYVPTPDTEEIICVEPTDPNPPELGVFVETQIDSNGCEFTHTLTVTLVEDLDVTATESFCAGETIVIGNQVISSDTTFYLEQESSNGCTFLVIFDMIFFPENEDFIDTAQICEGDIYTWNGFNILTPGFYILSAPDNNGCDARAEITLSFLPPEDCLTDAISAIPDRSPILLYPNPATESITLSGFGSSYKEHRVQIINSQAEVIETKRLTTSTTLIDISSYLPGLYFAVTNTGQANQQVIKFIKE